MAKLYFKYSTMNAGKSLDLLRINHNYIENGEKTICLASGLDNRYGKNKITSRTGISTDAISVDKQTNIYDLIKDMKDISCVLIDEIQFFTKEQIFQLSDIVDTLNIPVICFGLRSDFSLSSFEGSSCLMSICDELQEIKTICSCCKNKKAIVNARFENEKIVTKGNQVQIGGNESYKPLCRKCYKRYKCN
jgi:thymidine kinase